MACHIEVRGWFLTNYGDLKNKANLNSMAISKQFSIRSFQTHNQPERSFAWDFSKRCVILLALTLFMHQTACNRHHRRAFRRLPQSIFPSTFPMRQPDGDNMSMIYWRANIHNYAIDRMHNLRAYKPSVRTLYPAVAHHKTIHNHRCQSMPMNFRT